MLTLFPPDATMDDKLDELYFYLPIMWGEMLHVADVFGVHYVTVNRWLNRLRDEGLTRHVGNGWVKCYDQVEKTDYGGQHES